MKDAADARVIKLDSQKKKAICKAIIKNNRTFSIIQKIVKLIFMSGFLMSVVYAFLSCKVTDWHVVRVNGIDQIDYFEVIMFSGNIFILTSLIALFLKTYLKNISKKDCYERINESLYLENGVLVYAYQVFMRSGLRARNVISIPINDIEAIDYSPNLKKITLKGSFSREYVENFNSTRTIIPNKRNRDTFVFYDYFSPSLMTIFNQYNLSVTVMDQH